MISLPGLRYLLIANRTADVNARVQFPIPTEDDD
jgi:hypothetical protein